MLEKLVEVFKKKDFILNTCDTYSVLKAEFPSTKKYCLYKQSLNGKTSVVLQEFYSGDSLKFLLTVYYSKLNFETGLVELKDNVSFELYDSFDLTSFIDEVSLFVEESKRL